MAASMVLRRTLLFVFVFMLPARSLANCPEGSTDLLKVNHPGKPVNAAANGASAEVRLPAALPAGELSVDEHLPPQTSKLFAGQLEKMLNLGGGGRIGARGREQS